MSDSVPKDRCGYTYPEDHDVDDDLNSQNCCWRETVNETGRCIWHADPDEVEKTGEELQLAYEPDKILEQNSTSGELIDGANLSGLGSSEKLREIDFSEVCLRGANLSGADLFGANFSRTNLFDANLSEANLFGADLSEANLRETDLSEAETFGSDLTDADLVGADLSDAGLENTDFTGVDLRFADLTNANIQNSDLIGAELQKADLTRTNFQGSILSEANLLAADLTEANLTNTDLTDAHLRDVNLTESDLSDANISKSDFQDADLARSNLKEVNLSEANFQDANLTEVNFQFALISGTNFRGANLTKSDLRYVDLKGAILEEANLIKSNLSESDMRGVDGQEADFSEANLQNANLKRADMMNANLSGTDISGANLEDVSVLETDIKGAKLQVADFIRFSELLPLEVQEPTEIPPESGSSSLDGRWIESRVLLLSALYKERDSLLSLFQKYDNIEQDSGSYNSMIFEGNEEGEFIVKAVGDTGNAVIRESATNLIEEYNPHLVILYGIAAGFKSRVEKGDILVADKIVDLRKYKIEDGYSFEPNIVDSPGSREYPFKIKSITDSVDAPEISPELHTDMIIGSSDTLSRDEDFMEAAKDIHRKMGALEMEGAGVAEVCRKTDTDFFIVKSISDFGGGNKDDSLHGVCCDLAAETVLRGFLTDASI